VVAISISITTGILIFSGLAIYQFAVGNIQSGMVLTLGVVLVLLGFISFLRFKINSPSPAIIRGFKWFLVLMIILIAILGFRIWW
jgi:hypothetical protein